MRMHRRMCLHKVCAAAGLYRNDLYIHFDKDKGNSSLLYVCKHFMFTYTSVFPSECLTTWPHIHLCIPFRVPDHL